jgi:hypothetical protein
MNFHCCFIMSDLNIYDIEICNNTIILPNLSVDNKVFMQS